MCYLNIIKQIINIIKEKEVIDMAMKLLNAVELVKEDYSLIDEIVDCIQNRISWYEDREPESDGEVYDAWDEKKSEFEDCLEPFESAQDLINDDPNANKDEIDEYLEEGCNSIFDFQATYGGLSRWTFNSL